MSTLNVTRKEILIVDDEPWFRDLISKELKIAGYHTVLAQNGEEGLVALWEREHIGLVILDIRLPVINGMNFFKIIRKDFPDKRVIVTSVLQKDEQQFLINDADEYYDKSDDLSTLKEKVDIALNNRIRWALKENEKRNFRRVSVNVLANWEKNEHYTYCSCARFVSYSKDLSLLGGRFIIGEDIKAGEHFTMALELPVNAFPLLIDCEVVWIKKMVEFDLNTKSNFEAGVRFVKLDSPYDEDKLKDYLNCV